MTSVEQSVVESIERLGFRVWQRDGGWSADDGRQAHWRETLSLLSRAVKRS